MPFSLSSRLFYLAWGFEEGPPAKHQDTKVPLTVPFGNSFPTIITMFGASMRHYDDMIFKDRRTGYCTSGNLTAMSPDCVIYRTHGSEGYCNYAHELRVSPPYPSEFVKP